MMMEQDSTPGRVQIRDDTKGSLSQGVAILFIISITIAWWDDVLVVLQGLGVLLSSAYSFFGGMGIQKFAERVGKRTNIKPLGLGLLLWLIIIFGPTTFPLVLPTIPMTLSSLNLTFAILTYVINLAKILMFVYGFGYALFTYFGWGLAKIAYNSRERGVSSGYIFAIYFLFLGLVTLNTTIQIAIGIWYPTWIPIVNDVSIMRFLWLPLSALGLIIQWISFRSVKSLPSISPDISISHKIMMAIGTPLLIPSGYLLFIGPLPAFFIVLLNPQWMFGFMLLLGLSLITIPILSYIRQKEDLAKHNTNIPIIYDPLNPYPSLLN